MLFIASILLADVAYGLRLDTSDASCAMPDDGRVCVLALTDKSRNRRAGYVYDPHCDSWEVVSIENPGVDEHDARIFSISAMCGLSVE